MTFSEVRRSKKLRSFFFIDGDILKFKLLASLYTLNCSFVNVTFAYSMGIT
jgi:hypothetical protein